LRHYMKVIRVKETWTVGAGHSSTSHLNMSRFCH